MRPPSKYLRTLGSALSVRGDTGEIAARPRRFDEQHVGAGLAIQDGTLDGGVEALDRYGVGPCDD